MRSKPEVRRTIINAIGNDRLIQSQIGVKCRVEWGNVRLHVKFLEKEGIIAVIPNTKMPRKPHNKRIKEFYTLTNKGLRLMGDKYEKERTTGYAKEGTQDG